MGDGERSALTEAEQPRSCARQILPGGEWGWSCVAAGGGPMPVGTGADVHRAPAAEQTEGADGGGVTRTDAKDVGNDFFLCEAASFGNLARDTAPPCRPLFLRF